MNIFTYPRRKKNQKLIDIAANFELDEYTRGLAMKKIPFLTVVIQDGPYCNLSCSHCHGDFGPTKPKASLDLYKTIKKQIDKTEIENIIITDGEPTHDLARLEEIIKILKPYPIDISTNAWFANSVENTTKYLFSMKEAGLSIKPKSGKSTLQKKKDFIRISVDDFHKGSYERLIPFTKGFIEVFGQDLQKNRFNPSSCNPHFGILYTYNLKQNDKSSYNNMIDEYYSKVILPLKTEFHGNISFNGRGSLFRSEEVSIKISCEHIYDKGRARSLFDNIKKPIMLPEQMVPSDEVIPTLYVKSDGDAYWAFCFCCLRDGKKIGNIYETSLSEMIEKITVDPIFQANRMYGTKGLYTLLDNKDIKLRGNINCDICNQIFESPELMKELYSVLGK